MAAHDPCPEAPTLLAYAEGRLDDGRRAQAEVHLDACPACLAIVAELGRAAPGSPDEATDFEGASRYDIGPQIARGGMGRILQAWDRTLGRPVALKTVADDESPSLMQRLRREMALTARLQHPSIVPIYDAGRLDTGEPYYAMRWIEGRTLRQLIDECSDAPQRLALLPIVLSLAEAIAYAHSEGILHRDLKPSNIIVGPFGETVVLDWGLAKDLRDPGVDDLEGSAERSEPEAHGAMTADGQIMGTPGYIAPEQAQGGAVDERVDVYAVGVILLELATGRIPTTLELAPLHRSAAQTVPADLAAIVRRATQIEPAARYRDGSELARDLRLYAQGRLVSAHEYTLGQRVRRFVARHRLPIGLTATFVLALGVGGAYTMKRIVTERDVAQDARRLAQEQRERAEARRDAAQTLIQFIVEDLHRSLAEIGRSDLLAKVATSVLAYFEGVAVEDGAAGTTDLLQEGKTLEALGAALINASDIAGARRAFDGALARALTAAERGGIEATWLATSSRERLGYLDSIDGDLPGARRRLERVVADGQRELQLARDSDPGRWVGIVGAASMSLFVLDEREGHAEAARARLEQIDRLVAARVGPADAWAEATADLRLAVAQYRARDAAAAGDWPAYRAATAALVEAARSSAETMPEDLGRQGNLVAALMEDASACERTGDPYAALGNLQLALPLAWASAQRDPSNILEGSRLGTTLQFLAKNARERDAFSEAAAWFSQAEAVAADLRQRAPEDIGVLRTQSASSAKYLCLVQIEIGAYEDALAACSRSLQALAHAHALEPEHPHWRRDVGSVSTLAARAALGSGRLEEARRAADRAVVLARELLTEGDSPRDRFALVEALAASSAVADREGSAGVRRRAAEEARGILAEMDDVPDPEKAAAVADELDRLLPVGR